MSPPPRGRAPAARPRNAADRALRRRCDIRSVVAVPAWARTPGSPTSRSENSATTMASRQYQGCASCAATTECHLGALNVFIIATHRAIRRFLADPSAPHPRTLAVTATYPVDDGPDVLAFDPGWHRLFVASESGIVSIVDERGPGVGAGRRVPEFPMRILSPSTPARTGSICRSRTWTASRYYGSSRRQMDPEDRSISTTPQWSSVGCR